MVEVDDTGVLASMLDAEPVSATLLVAEPNREEVAPGLVARLEPLFRIPKDVLDGEISIERIDSEAGRELESDTGVEIETLVKLAEAEASSEYGKVDVD